MSVLTTPQPQAGEYATPPHPAPRAQLGVAARPRRVLIGGVPRALVRRLDLLVLLGVAMALTAGQAAVDLYFGGRLAYKEASTGAVVATPQGELFASLIAWVGPLVMLVLIGKNLQRGLQLGLQRLAAPVIYLGGVTAVNIVATGELTAPSPLTALLAVALWAIGPTWSDLVVVGVTGAMVATLSLLMPLATDKAWMADSLIATETKALIGTKVLAGPFAQMNVLGMALAVALPCALLARRRLLRWVLAIPIVAALVLTSSRTSLVAVGLATALVLAIRMMPPRWRPAGILAAAGGTLTGMAVLPFAITDPEAFTNRGGIWQSSMDVFRAHPFAGGGLGVFSADGAVKDPTGSPPWHAHNELATHLAGGGLLSAGLLLLLLGYALRGVMTSYRLDESLVPAYVLITLIMIGWAETPFRPDNFDGAQWATWTVILAAVLMVEARTRNFTWGAQRLAVPVTTTTRRQGSADG